MAGKLTTGTRAGRARAMMAAAARWHNLSVDNREHGNRQHADDEERIARRIMAVVSVLRAPSHAATITDKFIHDRMGNSANEFVAAVEQALGGTLPGRDTESPGQIRRGTR